MTVVKVWCALLHTWHVYISSVCVCMYILHCVLCLFTALPPVCNALSRYSCTINIKHNGHYIVEMKITLSEKHGILKCYDRKNPVGTYTVKTHCKNIWVTSTILWSSQLHTCCVCDTLCYNLTQSVVEKLLPFVILGSSCRRPISQHFW